MKWFVRDRGGDIDAHKAHASRDWYRALDTLYRATAWTVTMEAWWGIVTEHQRRTPTARRHRTPSTLLAVAAQWAQDIDTSAALRRSLAPAMACVHPVWITHLARLAGPWTGPSIRLLLGRRDAEDLVLDLRHNAHISTAAWRTLEVGMSLRDSYIPYRPWIVADLRTEAWARVGVSMATQRRAVALMRAATASEATLRQLPHFEALHALVRGGQIAWAACARVATETTSRAVAEVLLHHPHLPADVAMQWLTRHVGNPVLLALTAAHPTLPSHAGVRHLLWPHVERCAPIMAVFVQHGTPEESGRAFDLLVRRAPSLALALVARGALADGCNVAGPTLQRLLSHRRSNVRTSAIALLAHLPIRAPRDGAPPGTLGCCPI